jgi:hypothetical protein
VRLPVHACWERREGSQPPAGRWLQLPGTEQPLPGACHWAASVRPPASPRPTPRRTCLRSSVASRASRVGERASGCLPSSDSTPSALRSSLRRASSCGKVRGRWRPARHGKQAIKARSKNPFHPRPPHPVRAAPHPLSPLLHTPTTTRTPTHPHPPTHPPTHLDAHVLQRIQRRQPLGEPLLHLSQGAPTPLPCLLRQPHPDAIKPEGAAAKCSSDPNQVRSCQAAQRERSLPRTGVACPAAERHNGQHSAARQPGTPAVGPKHRACLLYDTSQTIPRKTLASLSDRTTCLPPVTTASNRFHPAQPTPPAAHSPSCAGPAGCTPGWS